MLPVRFSVQVFLLPQWLHRAELILPLLTSRTSAITICGRKGWSTYIRRGEEDSQFQQRSELHRTVESRSPQSVPNTSQIAVAPSTSKPQMNTAADEVEIQRKVERFTGFLVVVGFLQAGVIFLTWLVYCRQSKIMRLQAHEMKRQRGFMRLQWAWGMANLLWASMRRSCAQWHEV